MNASMQPEGQLPQFYLGHLRRLLVRAFGMEELKTFCFEIQVDYEELAGDTKSVLARNLVLYLARRDRLEELVTRASQLRPQIAWPGAIPVNAICPYRGLSVFREEDKEFFFGRATFVERLLGQVQQQALVAVMGPSGSGKSSVVFAGLLPELRHKRHWLMADFRPGEQPFRSLATALVPLIDHDLSEVDVLLESPKLAAGLWEGKVQIDAVINTIKQKNPDIDQLLLIVDQFEELYTLCPDQETRVRFLDLLLSMRSAGDKQSALEIKTLITLRADFFGQALTHRPFADALQESIVTIGPMTREEIKSTIVQPAQLVGLRFEPGLVDRILDDVTINTSGQARAGTLPLLEFALTQLWAWQADGLFTHAAYETIGQVEGALAGHAEAVFDELEENEQVQFRRVIVQMIQPGVGTEDTKRRALRTELSDDWELVQRLADSRLIVTDKDERNRETAELIHEALIQRWERLRAWMDADRSFRGWQERLRASLRQWEASDYDDGALLRGVPLAEAKHWLIERDPEVSESEKQFIKTSIDSSNRELEEKEKQRDLALASARVANAERVAAQAERMRAIEAEQKTRRRATYLVIALVATLGAAALAVMFANSSRKNEALAFNALATVQASGSADLALGALATEEALSDQNTGSYPTPGSRLDSGYVARLPSAKPIRLVIANFVTIGSAEDVGERLRNGLRQQLETVFAGPLNIMRMPRPTRTPDPENPSDIASFVELSDWDSLQVGPLRGASVDDVDASASLAALASSTDILVYAIVIVDRQEVRIIPRYVMWLNCMNLSKDLAGLTVFRTPEFRNPELSLGGEIVLNREPDEQAILGATEVLFEQVMARITSAADICRNSS